MVKLFFSLLLCLIHLVSSSEIHDDRKNIIIIGGGWAGFATAYAILIGINRAKLAASVNVILLEGAPRPGGLAAGWTSARGKKVEAGIHGFWRCYENIEEFTTKDLGLTGDKSPFTPWTPSALWTKDHGLTVVAPVFGDQPQLPTPLGTAIYPKFPSLSPVDLLSAVPLAFSWLDFDGSSESWQRYDQMTARELFKQAGMSAQLYDQFILPLLLVLPMCPGEDCSAAAALSLFSYFALEHQSDFDVKWLKGSATDLIFKPWRKKLIEMGATILNDKKVEKLQMDASNVNVISVTTADGTSYLNIAAIVSCTGIAAAQGIVRANPFLSSRTDFAALLRLRAVDVVAVRIWFKPNPPSNPSHHVDARTSGRCKALRDGRLLYASNVGGNNLAPGLASTGCTFYDITALQGPEPDVENGESKDKSLVIEVDFYYAPTLLGQSDETVLQQALTVLKTADPQSFSDHFGNLPSSCIATLTLSSYSHVFFMHRDFIFSSFLPSLGRHEVEDYVVIKIPRAVSHFAPGMFESLPNIQTSISNVFMAGGILA